MIYSSRAQPEVNKSRIHAVPKNNVVIFHMGKVSELWRKALIGKQFSCFQFEQLFIFFKCNNNFGKINLTLLK